MAQERSGVPMLVALVGILTIALVAYGSTADFEEESGNDDGVRLLDDDEPFVAFFDDLSERNTGVAVDIPTEPNPAADAEAPSPAPEVADPVSGDDPEDPDLTVFDDEVAGVVIEADDRSKADSESPRDIEPTPTADAAADAAPQRGARNLEGAVPGS